MNACNFWPVGGQWQIKYDPILIKSVSLPSLWIWVSSVLLWPIVYKGSADNPISRLKPYFSSLSLLFFRTLALRTQSLSHRDKFICKGAKASKWKLQLIIPIYQACRWHILEWIVQPRGAEIRYSNWCTWSRN